MFALQSPVGLKFGATISLDAERITFEMDVELTKGSSFKFRMELVGVEDTVMGTIRIDRALPKRQGSLQRYIARIVDMPEADRMAFDGWRRDQATGGISRRLERDPEAIKQRIVDSMRGATEAESRLVLDKMNQKSIYKRKSADIVEGDPFGLEQESGAQSTQDSSSMRDSLRDQSHQNPTNTPVSHKPPEVPATAPQDSPPAIPKGSSNTKEANWMRPLDTTGVESEQPTNWLETADGTDPLDLGSVVDSFDLGVAAEASEPNPVATPGGTIESPQPQSTAQDASVTSTGFSIPVPPSEPAPQVEPEASAASPPPPPPTITVDGSQTPIEIQVIFGCQQSVAQIYNSELITSSITIPDSSLTQLYTPVKVNFTFHDQQTMSIFGQTVSQTSNGMAIALELNTRQRLILGQLALG